MNILIDFTQIPVQKCGIGIYALNLISNLQKLDKDNIYYILVQDDDNSLDFILNPRFHIIKVSSKLFRKLPLRFFLEQLYIPYFTLRHKIDIVHSLHYSFPLLLPSKRVVVIPDMTFFKFPQHHLPFKRYYFRFFIYMATILSVKIITISESSKDDLLERFKTKGNKIEVVYLGKDPLFNSNLDKKRTDLIKKKYRINGEYILYIGTIEPRKNIKSLILAFSKLLQEHENCQLVIAGRKGWNYKEIFRLVDELSLKEDIIFTDFVDEAEKPFLIAGAKIFVYPSFYEGFGIPVLEALSCGIPTITSNVSSLPEVAGDAALLVDPLNVDELHLSIAKLFNNHNLYAELKKRSLNQAGKFNWKRTAQETMSIYSSL